MTSTAIQTEELPPLASFLSSVAPGINELHDNIHFTHDFSSPKIPQAFSWPLSSSNSIQTAQLTPTYLNVSRPVLNPGPGLFESNTYVSLPFHITNLFNQIIDTKANNTLDGGMQIGANVGSMMPDPFHLVHLNPGCLTEIIELNNNPRYTNPFVDSNRSDSKNPFTKLTSNFNKLLKIAGPGHEVADSNSLFSVFDSFTELVPEFSNKNQLVFNKLLAFNESSYYNEISSVNTSRLLISANVNVVSIMALDQDYNYLHTQSVTSSKPYTSLLEKADQEPKSYQKVIETPLLRFSLKNHLVVTCMKSFNFNNTPLSVLGLNSGEILVINLKTLTYKLLLSSQRMDSKFNSSIKYSSNLTNTPVTCLDILHHPVYHCVFVVGTSSGEVLFVNPFSSDIAKYTKTIVDKDQFVTYFKKFDLSPFSPKYDASEIIGHIKLSYKPMTSISSTTSFLNSYSVSSHLNPMLLAVGADDGLVRLISLTSTSAQNYGSNSKSVVSDLISNYFHYGIRSVTFSPDFKFLAVAGNGDLIELFRLGYYNVNSLVHKNHSQGLTSGGRRSRSTTVNSASSASINPSNSLSLFLSPTVTSPSVSLDVNSANPPEDSSFCVPAVKDIRLMCRLRGHANTISRVQFIREEQVFESELEDKKPSSSLYRLLSIGNDGKVLFWEFDYKALPKVKRPVSSTKSKKPSSAQAATHSPSFVMSSAPSKRNPKMKSGKTDTSLGLPLSNLSSPSGSHNNMNSILTQADGSQAPPSHLASQVNLEEVMYDQIKGILGLYGSLYEIRFKKHYTSLIGKTDDSRLSHFSSIVHPIVDDKLVPCIETPVSSVDMSYWFSNGQISGVWVDGRYFWCFGRNGDLITYQISGLEENNRPFK
ncbi:hypothetical protein CANTEDRAFT_107256 [Yamadazyma tenuis ATCC 10573]|uniref:WD40 repeat-like protein n=2 Tax=Candida tenuis TaxID=2315449 RepID=G3BBG2_CANTC|nr:uncharacterized protein CANTEDRAFT_107256 [Yamadazyma tenuis ATCC 10573]EGV62182.1 hypothetical protein CANTEDRAFT_107256 [Yamadazyma tenuis ATCC 10573]